MEVWCSEVAALIGKNRHISAWKASVTVLKRALGASNWRSRGGPCRTDLQSDTSKRRMLGCRNEQHVYRSICMHTHPDCMDRFVCEKGIYHIVGQLDGMYDNDSIIEVKTRMRHTNYCFDHEHVQVQTYMECLNKKRCLFVQHIIPTTFNYTLWLRRDKDFWNHDIEPLLTDAIIKIYAMLYIVAWIRLCR